MQVKDNQGKLSEQVKLTPDEAILLGFEGV